MAVDLRESVDSWRTLALTLDHFTLALALGSVLPEEDPRAEALAQAEQHIFAGNLDAARLALKQNALDEVPDHSPNSRVGLVAAALAAAAGDDRSYARILALGPMNDWLPGYLLGVVAEARGDQQIADQAWLDTGGRLQIVTRFSFPRWAAAMVSQRGNSWDQDTLLCQIAHQAAQLPHTLASDPQPALAAIERLQDRNDAAGARLLVRSLRASYPDIPAAALPETPAPTTMTRRERWTEFRLGHPDCPRKRQLTAIRDEWVTAISCTLALLLGLSLADQWRDWRIPVILLSLGIFAPVFVFWGRKIQIWHHLRRLAQTREIQRREAEHCRCSRSQFFVDNVAQTYADCHLESATKQPDSAIKKLSEHGFNGQLLTCPATGVLWLGVDLDTPGPRLVLRG